MKINGLVILTSLVFVVLMSSCASPLFSTPTETPMVTYTVAPSETPLPTETPTPTEVPRFSELLPATLEQCMEQNYLRLNHLEEDMLNLVRLEEEAGLPSVEEMMGAMEINRDL